MPDIPKFKKVVIIEADVTVGFDGSTVNDADLSATVATAVSNDPEWANATGLLVTVKGE